MCYYHVMKYRVLRKQNISAQCIVCGQKNDLGLKTNFYECQDTNGEHVLVAVFTPKEEHQSYPGRMHGGMTAAVLDEAIGRAISITRPELWGVTIDLCVKYRKPMPLGQVLYCVTKITKVGSRSFEGEGKIMDEHGNVLSTAEGKYLILEPKKISPEGLTEENWFYVEENLPDAIFIGTQG